MFDLLLGIVAFPVMVVLAPIWGVMVVIRGCARLLAELGRDLKILGAAARLDVDEYYCRLRSKQLPED